MWENRKVQLTAAHCYIPFSCFKLLLLQDNINLPFQYLCSLTFYTPTYNLFNYLHFHLQVILWLLLSVGNGGAICHSLWLIMLNWLCTIIITHNNNWMEWKMLHPFPTLSELPPPPLVKVKPALMVHQCNECDFQCNLKQDFKRHRMYHDAKSTYQCPWCSFSVNFSAHLTRHVKKHHPKIDRKFLARKQQVF